MDGFLLGTVSARGIRIVSQVLPQIKNNAVSHKGID